MLREDFKLPVFFSFLAHLVFFAGLIASDTFFFSRAPTIRETDIFIEDFEVDAPNTGSIASKAPPKIELKPSKVQKNSTPAESPKIGVKAPKIPDLTQKISSSSSAVPPALGKSSTAPNPPALKEKAKPTPVQPPSNQSSSANESPPLVAESQTSSDSGAKQPAENSSLVSDTASVEANPIFDELNEEEKQVFKLESGYRKNLTNKVSSNWELPAFAKGEKFDVQIQVILDKAGKIVNLKFLKKAKNDLINIAAKNAILDSIPFPSMPAEFPEGKLLPVTFRFSNGN